MTDCIVVGGGLIGMLTARELAGAGMSVAVLERGQAGGEASWAGGGILSPLYPWRYPESVSRLAAWSQRHYPRIAEGLKDESGVDPEWIQSGMLILDTVEKDQALRWAQHFQAELRTLEGSEIGVCEPALGTPPQQAIWMPEVGQVRNPRMVRAARGSILARGVELREGVDVTGLIIQGGRVQGVATTQGRMEASRVIVAGGAWTPNLFEALGLHLEVVPVRGQMIVFRAQPGLVTRIVLNQGRYLIPRRDGRIVTGSTLEYVGFDKATTESALADLREAAFNLVPSLRDFQIERHWSGLRPGSPDGVPYIGGFNEINGLYVNAGHFRNGVILGPASTRLLADLVLGREPIVDPEPYAPSTRTD
jgi:glycine oxidase